MGMDLRMPGVVSLIIYVFDGSGTRTGVHQFDKKMEIPRSKGRWSGEGPNTINS